MARQHGRSLGWAEEAGIEVAFYTRCCSLWPLWKKESDAPSFHAAWSHWRRIEGCSRRSLIAAMKRMPTGVGSTYHTPVDWQGSAAGKGVSGEGGTRRKERCREPAASVLPAALRRLVPSSPLHMPHDVRCSRLTVVVQSLLPLPRRRRPPLIQHGTCTRVTPAGAAAGCSTHARLDSLRSTRAAALPLPSWCCGLVRRIHGLSWYILLCSSQSPSPISAPPSGTRI